MIVCYIDAYRVRSGVEPICRVLSAHGMQIAPSTYYAAAKRPVSDADLTDAYLANALVDLFRANRSLCATCGTPPAAPASTSAATRSPG